MANAINLISSAPFAGLGTASFTITSAGLYTMAFKSFLPYFAAGSPPQSSVPVNESQTVTTVADVSGSLNSTYFTLYDAGNAHGYYVWYNINSAGVDPAPAGLTGIPVAAATGASANTIASNSRTAIAAAVSSVTVSGATNQIIISNNFPGSNTAAANGTASPGFSYSVGTAGSFGVPPISGLVVTLQQNSTVLAVFANPSPTQPITGSKIVVNTSVNDVLSWIFSSQSTADSALNAVKSIINLYAGE
jgi:hypothetical protein